MISLLMLKGLLLGAVFLLCHRLRYYRPYSEHAARIASIVWAIMAVFIALLAKGVSLAALSLALLSIAKVTAVLYAIQLLDTTVLWFVVWPLGFALLLLF